MTRLSPRGHTDDDRTTLMEPWATLEPGDVQPGMPEMACAEPMAPSVPTRRHRRTASTRRQVSAFQLRSLKFGVALALLAAVLPLPF